MTRRAVLCVFLVLFGAHRLWAQTDDNAHAWVMYFGDHPLGGSKFEMHAEGQWRRSRLGETWQQLLLRPGINYPLTKKVVLSAGYGFVETYPYGEFPVAARFAEHRTYEQVQLTPRALGLEWQNRLRLEQRHFRGRSARDENRFRYMLRSNVRLPWRERKYYVGLWDEVFYNFGDQVASNTFDQNRAAVAVGRYFKEHTRVEIGFMEQTVQHRDGRVFEHNHTLHVAMYSRLPIGRRP